MEFQKDWASLASAGRERFQRIVLGRFVPDLVAGSFRPGLRVKRVEGTPDVWEMTWAPDGRATWQYAPDSAADPHVIWRRVGTHDVLWAP